MNKRAFGPVVDIHTHFFPETWPDLDARSGGAPWPWMKHTEPGKATVMLGDTPFRPVGSACRNMAERLADMDRDGIDSQIICNTPVMFSYERPLEHALEAAKLFNDIALEMAAEGGDRFLTLCQVPLQDIDASCLELSRAMEAGHLGAQIGNHVGPANLDDDGIITFLHHCADEGAAVLVHPWDMMARERMPKHMMAWTVGMPAETQLAMVSLILGGGFDRLPESLRICFAHGGGSFAFLLGRLDNAWHRRDIARGAIDQPPSAYMGRFYADCAVFDERALALLVDVVGGDRVVLGSDYPFPLGEERVGGLVREASGLDAAAKERILCANALRFLGLEEPVPAAPIDGKVGAK